MGKRLTKIYTKTGDRGETGLGDGTRVAKDSQRVIAMGDIDELNSAIGMVLSNSTKDEVREVLTRVQHQLFNVGGELSLPDQTFIKNEDVEWLENRLDRFNETLPPLEEFILPGGSPAAAACHLARAICRRAERDVVALAREENINDELRKYLNRLSDLLFVICRILSREVGEEETYWDTPELADEDW